MYKNIIVNNMIINRGTCAGGFKTIYNCKDFEKKTNIEQYLLNNRYKKEIMNKTIFGYKLTKIIDKKEIVYVTQGGFRIYMKQQFNKNIFRNPDEAYIIKKPDEKCVVKILEKKNQNTEGSVELKLYTGRSFIKEYSKVLGNTFEIKYAFCLSNFYKKKFNSNKQKYIIMKQIINEDNVEILYGEDDNYIDKLNEWINK